MLRALSSSRSNDALEVVCMVHHAEFGSVHLLSIASNGPALLQKFSSQQVGSDGIALQACLGYPPNASGHGTGNYIRTLAYVIHLFCC